MNFEAVLAQDWLYVGGLWASFSSLVLYVLWLKSPHYLERVMARKQERRKVADIVSAALQDAAREGKLTPEQWHKYNKKLATALELPDMLPNRKVNYPWQFDVTKARALCVQRLTAMGVNIADGLKKVRRNRPSKKERLVIARRKS